MFLTDNII